MRRGLAPVMEGAAITAVEQRRVDLRFPFPADFAARLVGRKVISVGRRAKFLIIHLDADPVLIAHLGMSGSFRIYGESSEQTPGEFHYERSKIAAHDHVVFHLEQNDERHRVVYNDPRRFGFMAFAQGRELDSHPFLASLGIEPTGNTLDGIVLSALFAGRRSPLKAALLDQRLIAGLGNIYVCEALWRAGLSPRRVSGSVRGKRAARLADAIRSVIGDAIAAGGSTLRDHQLTDGSLGYFQHTFSVYDQEGRQCRRGGCEGKVKRIVQSGRSTFYCSTCQR